MIKILGWEEAKRGYSFRLWSFYYVYRAITQRYRVKFNLFMLVIYLATILNISTSKSQVPVPIVIILLDSFWCIFMLILVV